MNLFMHGKGVQSRIPLLKKHLDPRFEILTEDTAENRAKAEAVLAMPRAVNWHKGFENLRFIQLPGAGLDGLVAQDVPNQTEVCNVYEHGPSIAEYVFSRLFYLGHKQLEAAHQALGQGHWPYFDRTGGGVRFSFCGKTFGVLGYGYVGSLCADIAQKFAMPVAAYTPSPKSQPGVRFVKSVEELCRDSDVLLVSCRESEATKNIISYNQISQMKPHAILINVARGSLINEAAVFEALSEKRLGGAILDVWRQYPSTATEQLKPSTLGFEYLDQVVLSPHLAANTRHMVEGRWRFMAENLNRFLNDQPRVNTVIQAQGGVA